MEEVDRREPNYPCLFPDKRFTEQIIARYQRHPYSGNSPLT
jgi:hypothetical protein